MKLSPIASLLAFGLTTGWLIASFAWAGLFVELASTDGFVIYPGAVRLAATHYGLSSLPQGYIKLRGRYHTPNALPQVLKWYLHDLKPELDQGLEFIGSCVQFTVANNWLLVQQDIGSRLCSEAAGTTIYVDRTLTLLQ